MEFNISDLLDGLTEVSVDIQPKAGASAERIKELTMKKIHSERKQGRRTLSAISKILIAAAVLASLAVPVMAATGFQFTDWLDGVFVKGEDYDTDLLIGSESKNWEHAGWVFNLSAEEADATGLMVCCEEFGNEAHSGTLTTDDAYWLEVWDGEGYEAMPAPEKEISAGKTYTIKAGSSNGWAVDWSDTYGTLEPGSYRLGKKFVYTDDSGKQEIMTNYVKFRIFTEDMAPYIEACRASVEEVRNRDSYHLTVSQDGDTIYTGEAYDQLIMNYWKSGEDFLIERQYQKGDGTLVAHNGYLMRGGQGYKLNWNGDNALSGVSGWEVIDWLEESDRDMWDFQLEIFDGNVGEVYVEENTTYLLNGSVDSDGNEDYRLQSFTMDANGKLTFAQKLWLENKDDRDSDEYCKVEVHDTSAAEIAKVIAAQTVDKAPSFSWQEEQAKYPAGAEGVKTEGFVNTAPQGTVTLENVVSIARKECTMEWQNTAVAYYDESAEIWKVELGFSQDDSCQIVYLNNQGITQLVVTE